MPIKIFSYKSLLIAGLFLNVALFIYVYFIVDGGPTSVQQDGGWMAIISEIPITFVLLFGIGIQAILHGMVELQTECPSLLHRLVW